MDSPYKNLPESAFWAPSVGKRSCFDIEGLWTPKFNFKKGTRIATFGSCFAQHFGAALKAMKLNWVNSEPAPRGMLPENERLFGYNVFSCRTGNIYTASLLAQWVRWAIGDEIMPEEHWEAEEGRVIDPFRPRIEPDGFVTDQEMFESRKQAISSFRLALVNADVLVFTLGLTESWHHTKGWEYPMCPGTVAGSFSEKDHRFENQGFTRVKNALEEALSDIRKLNPGIKFLLTVSPVPLTATNSGNHVLSATMYSKSVLRAVAGELAQELADVDYFPSFEIINSPAFQGVFFEPNKRNVSKTGVNFVMNTFFKTTGLDALVENNEKSGLTMSSADAICDEELLAAFSGG